MSWKKLKAWKKKRRYKELTEWRDHLVEYEEKTFIPEIKSRVVALKQYFDEINTICDAHSNNPTFGAALRLIIDPSKLGTQGGYITATDPQLANSYFSQMKAMNTESYIEPAQDLIQNHSIVTNLSDLASYLNKVNFMCSSIIQIKQKIFLYNMRVFHTLHSVPSGQLVQSHPAEYTLIIMPFKILLENIVSVADSTSQTIHQWHKEQIEWKTKSMNVWTEQLNRKNQLLTIGVATALSAFFLTIADPYKMLQQESHIQKLNDEINLLKSQAPQCPPVPPATSPNYQPQGPTSKPGAKK